MNTGLDSFADPANITALYPFVGTEVPLAIIGFVLWIAWHVVTAREENRQWDELDGGDHSPYSGHGDPGGPPAA